MTAALNALLAPVQAAFDASPEWQEIARKAYPPAAEEKNKKDKKVKKDKGSKHPGAVSAAAASTVEAQRDGAVHGPSQAEIALASDAEKALEMLDLEKKAVGTA